MVKIARKSPEAGEELGVGKKEKAPEVAAPAEPKVAPKEGEEVGPPQKRAEAGAKVEIPTPAKKPETEAPTEAGEPEGTPRPSVDLVADQAETERLGSDIDKLAEIAANASMPPEEVGESSVIEALGESEEKDKEERPKSPEDLSQPG